MSELILPRIYKSEDGKYAEYDGKYKLSYSQYTSWKEPEYKPEYILQYFGGAKVDAGIFAAFGGDVGTYIEHKANGDAYEPTMIGDDDIKVLESLDYPPNCVYEDEIVVDMGDFVIQGFIDRSEFLKPNAVGILDYKTGSIEKKEAFYGSEEYGQTTLYTHQKVLEGNSVAYSKVIILDRKGNGFEKHPLRLTGLKKEVDTPYSTERAEKLLADMRKVAIEISEAYQLYLKVFGAKS